MPVYNEETFNYEILLRFGDVAPNKGKLTGAHRQTITQTTKDGLPIPGGTNINPPEQLALVTGEQGELLADVLGAVNTQTIIDNQNLQVALATAQDSISALNTQLSEANSEIQRLNDLVSTLQQQSAKDSQTHRDEIDRLTAMIPATDQVTAEEPAEEPAPAV